MQPKATINDDNAYWQLLRQPDDPTDSEVEVAAQLAGSTTDQWRADRQRVVNFWDADAESAEATEEFRDIPKLEKAIATAEDALEQLICEREAEIDAMADRIRSIKARHLSADQQRRAAVGQLPAPESFLAQLASIREAKHTARQRCHATHEALTASRTAFHELERELTAPNRRQRPDDGDRLAIARQRVSEAAKSDKDARQEVVRIASAESKLIESHTRTYMEVRTNGTRNN